MLLLSAQEIALENAVPLSEVLGDIDGWRTALGKWTRTVEALYKLCSSAESWAALKLEPTEKRVIKKKCEEVFAQIQAQQQTPSPTAAAAAAAPTSTAGSSVPISASVSAPPTAGQSLPVIEEPRAAPGSRTAEDPAKLTRTPTPGGPDGGLPQRIKVPMKGSDTTKRGKGSDEKRSPTSPAVLAPVPSPSNALLSPASPAPERRGPGSSTGVAPTPSSPATLTAPIAPSPSAGSPAPARPMVAAGADLSLAITKIFEIVKQKSAKELRLSGKQLEKTHLKLIFDSLLQTGCVSHVELRQASLGDEGATLIAKFLKSNKCVAVVSVCGSNCECVELALSVYVCLSLSLSLCARSCVYGSVCFAKVWPAP